MIRDWLRRYRNFIGCCIIVYIHSGVNGVASALMPQLKLYYDTELSTIIMGASICCIAIFLSSFYGASLIRWARPQNALAIGSGCGFAFSILIASSQSIPMFYLGCACAGLMVAWGTFATCNVYIDRYYQHHRSLFIAFLSTVAMIGTASFQYFSGKLIAYKPVDQIYLILGGLCLFALLLNRMLLSQIEIEETTHTSSIKQGTMKYHSPLFLKMAIVAFLGSALTGTFGSLCTTFLQSKDISVSMSTTYLSFYTLAGGLFALISGWMAEKYGWKCYVIAIYLSFMLGMVCATLWEINPLQRILLGMMLLLVAFALPTATTYNMLSKPLFQEHALWANTKLLSIGYFGSTLCLPLFTQFYESYGFISVWIILFLLSTTSMLLLLSAIQTIKKERNSHEKY